jgi:hypothetical protein
MFCGDDSKFCASQGLPGLPERGQATGAATVPEEENMIIKITMIITIIVVIILKIMTISKIIR